MTDEQKAEGQYVSDETTIREAQVVLRRGTEVALGFPLLTLSSHECRVLLDALARLAEAEKAKRVAEAWESDVMARLEVAENALEQIEQFDGFSADVGGGFDASLLAVQKIARAALGVTSQQTRG